jgi:hypothetical protein
MTCWCGAPRAVEHVHMCGLGVWLYDLVRRLASR